MELLKIFQSLVPLLAPFLIFAACCYYLIRIRAMDSLFLCVGSGISLLMTGFFTYLPYYAQSRALAYESMSPYYVFGGIVSLVGSILFTIGLIMVIDKVIQLSVKNYSGKDQFNF